MVKVEETLGVEDSPEVDEEEALIEVDVIMVVEGAREVVVKAIAIITLNHIILMVKARSKQI